MISNDSRTCRRLTSKLLSYNYFCKRGLKLLLIWLMHVFKDNFRMIKLLNENIVFCEIEKRNERMVKKNNYMERNKSLSYTFFKKTLNRIFSISFSHKCWT